MSAVLVAGLGVLCLLTLVLCTEVWFGAKPSSKDDEGSSDDFIVLVPAHNEGEILAETLAQLLDLVPRDQLLVIADNCDDNTAAIAQGLGVPTAERRDPNRRGKAYALDFARAKLSANPPGIVVVVDADTLPERRALQRLAAHAAKRRAAVQSAYFFTTRPSDPIQVRFSCAAVFIKNVVRQLGTHRLAAPALLTGSGWAIPWSVFEKLPLETGHLTEDLMLGVTECLAGRPPVFLPSARVTSAAAQSAGTVSQRRRWESGYWSVFLVGCPQLIKAALVQQRPTLFWAALSLATPPFVLLAALDVLAIGLVWAWATGPLLDLAGLLGSLLVMLAVGVVVALVRHGQRGLLVEFWKLPGVLAWKLALSIGVLLKREKSWVRTQRKGEGNK